VSLALTRDSEAHGAAFDLAAMVKAQDLTFDAVRRVAAAIRPGMTEIEACARADQIIADMGADRLWHKNVIRFAEGTLDTFHAPFDAERQLGERDIFFVDLGVVWGGHEGDAGDTFVTGDDPEMLACVQAARDLWTDVAEYWRSSGVSGAALYDYATQKAQAMGWVLNLEVRGHRVCDFPHAIYRAGALGDFGHCPTTGLWILEIQIGHPTRPFGAFFEDLLIGETVSSETR
jgi:Xaa-Pro aminopeptidase